MAPRGEPKLTDELRAYVVQELAAYIPPSIVADAIRKEFGIKITPQSIEAYDPTKRAGAKLAMRWRVLFEATRKAVREDVDAIGIANRNVRLRTLQRMAVKAETSGNMALVANLLEQAAKEVGNTYTNTRVLTGAGGSPLIPPSITPTMTPKEAADAYADELSAGG